MKRLMLYSVVALIAAGCATGPTSLADAPAAPAAWTSMESVDFQWQRWDLEAKSELKIARVAAWMKDNPTSSVSLGVHRDEAWANDEETTVRPRRVRVIRAALVAAGIAPERIAVGFQGGPEPVCNAASTTCREVSRRVEILAAPR